VAVDASVGTLLSSSVDKEGGMVMGKDMMKLEEWAREKAGGRELIAAEVRYN
jgi:hypothetical protein